MPVTIGVIDPDAALELRDAVKQDENTQCQPQNQLAEIVSHVALLLDRDVILSNRSA